MENEELIQACKELRKFLYPNGMFRGEANMKGILDAIQPMIKCLGETE